MKIFRLLVLAVFVLSVLICSGTYVDCYELKKGEKLTYSAWFLNVIPFGEAAIQIKDITRYKGKKVYVITCEAETAKWISLLFKAEAVLKSYMDVNKLYPYKFEQILKVAGKPDDVRRAFYNRVNNVMEAEGKGRKKVPRDVRDPVSAIFYLRTRKLQEGAEVRQIVNNNQSNYIFSSKVSGKKKVGNFDCWVLDARIRRENKSMYHSMDAVFFISDDEHSLPVLIKAKTKVGPMSLKLKGFE